jgi:hypothetical protein
LWTSKALEDGDGGTMNQERLEQLISAYGAEPARWPAAERAEAERRLNEDATASEPLALERALDAVLDSWAPQFPTMALRNRILAEAPVGRGARLSRRGLLGGRGLWLSGAGLAAACAAGVAVGAGLIAPSLANAFPGERSQAAAYLADGVSVFGSPLDAGVDG